ncbi:MAG TPA: PepSY domain-containing protein [Candidatus Binatia bacterium]|nr:PepSY domain-containing protein [Candidatus Binatia bacterium]
MKLLHKVIFWSHLLAGIIGGVVIFIMSATGFILMYEHQLVEWAERDVREITAPSAAARRLGLDDLVARAHAQNPDARPTGVVLRNEPTASVAVGFGRDGATYVNPYTGEVLGKGSKLDAWFHDVIDWHRWLGAEGDGRATGRAITGISNLAFFWLAITGVYLWWPRSWHWRGLKPSLVFNPRLRGKARDWNWHNVIGFWSSGVLVVLTLTAVVMSYPWANDLLYTLAGSEPPPRTQGSSPIAQAQGRGAIEAGERKPLASFDAFRERAEQQAPGWVMMMMRLPTRSDGPITILIQEPSAPHIFARSQLQLDRSTAELIKWEPYADASVGRKLRVWVRGLHTGEALGFLGQTVAGLASLGGCFLVWTGLAMAWRRFRYRKGETDEVLIEESATERAEMSPAILKPTSQINERSMEVSSINMEETNSTASNGHSHNRYHDTRTEWTTRPFNAESVLILYGTVTGTAESVAHKLAARLRRHGVTAGVRDMAHCQPSVLEATNLALIVISTYGDGEPPDDAANFYQAIINGRGLNLSGLQFSVLALGNRTFDHFCRCGKEIDKALERYGARRIYPRVDCDVDYEVPAKHWLNGVLVALEQNDRIGLSA